jgi:transposase
MSGHCKDCVHWTPFDPTNPGGSVYRALLHAKPKAFGLCAKANGIKRDPTSLAYAEDGSDYKANFRTSPEFGCVMFEAK